MNNNADHKIKNILITGIPGIGKTTLIKSISQELKLYEPTGFYTEEIKERNERKGFRLISLNGREGILSHVDLVAKYRVSKYGVDIKGFEDFLDSIDLFNPAVKIIIIDEIGKMECLSQKFNKMITQMLDSDKIVIATISLKGIPFIETIRRRRDVKLHLMTRGNRDSLSSIIFYDIRSSLT